MQEHIRTHERLKNEIPRGQTLVIEGVLSHPITVYLPQNIKGSETVDLLIHFNGAAYVPIKAVDELKKPVVLAIVHQGSGSSVYASPFKDPKMFDRLVEEVRLKADIKKTGQIYCSAFSAGYGAVRELLKSHTDQIDGLLLLDGLHTDYIPEATPLAQGGKLNTEKLITFLNYAKKAVGAQKKMVITHSTIFPGNYASTTETAHWLIKQIGLNTTSVLKWGPVGMQQLGEVESGNLKIMAFAGNSAPDHIDHFHGMPQFLKYLCEP